MTHLHKLGQSHPLWPYIGYPHKNIRGSDLQGKKKKGPPTSTKYAYGDGELRSRFGVTRRAGQAKKVHKAGDDGYLAFNL